MAIPWDQEATAQCFTGGLQPAATYSGTLREVVTIVREKPVNGDGWLVKLNDTSQEWEGRDLHLLIGQLPDD